MTNQTQFPAPAHDVPLLDEDAVAEFDALPDPGDCLAVFRGTNSYWAICRSVGAAGTGEAFDAGWAS